MQFAINFFISSSVLIGIIILLRFCFQGIVNYRILYSLWLFAALRLIFPFPIGQTSISVMHSTAYLQKWINPENSGLFSEIKGTTSSSQSNKNASQNMQSNDTNHQLQLNDIKNNQQTDVKQKSQTNIEWQIVQNPDGENSIKNTDNDSTDSAERNNPSSASKIYDGTSEPEQKEPILFKDFSMPYHLPKSVTYLLNISLIGSILLFTAIISVNIIFNLRLKRQRTPFSSHVHTKLPVYTAAAIKTPCLYGFFHPCIYLPEGFPEKLSEKNMHYILEHEHMHYCHKDHLWAGLRLLLICIYWLHPMVWCAAILSKKDAELACDESVLKNKDSEQALAYAAMLLEVAKTGRGMHPFCYNMAAHNHKKELKRRMKAITHKKYYKKSHMTLFAGLFVIALIATFSGYTEDSQAAVPAKKQTFSDTEKHSVITQNLSDTENNHTSAQNTDAQNSSETEQNSEHVPSSPESAVNPIDNTVSSIKTRIPRIMEQKGGTKRYAIDVANSYTPIIFEENEAWESMYTDFLSKRKKKWSYYSLVYLGNMETPVLLTANHIQKLSNGKHSVNVSGFTCLFAVVGQTVRPIGQINCSSSGEYLHLSDGNLYSDTHHSLSSFGVNSENWFVSTTIYDTDSFDSIDDSFQSQFFRHFDIADSVVFHKNNLKKSSSNDHVFEKKSAYYTQILTGAAAYTTSYLVGTNSRKHKVVIRECEAKKENGSNAVKIYSPTNKKKVIWTSDANALIPEKRVKLYIVTQGRREYILRYIPEEDENGNCNYHWEQFYLNEQGEEQITAQDEIQFQRENMSDEDKESLKQFTKNLWNNRLENASVMLYAWEFVSLGGNPKQEQIYLKGLYSK